jgi:hypothetical protein
MDPKPTFVQFGDGLHGHKLVLTTKPFADGEIKRLIDRVKEDNERLASAWEAFWRCYEYHRNS